MPFRNERAKPPTLRILIVGAGITGLVAAIGLRRKHHDVIIFESSASLQTAGGSLLIPPSAARVLDHIGVWDTVLANNTPPPGMDTFRYADGTLLESIDYVAAKERFGYRVMALTREKYQRILYEDAIRAGVEVHFASRIDHIDPSTPSLTLTNGERIDGDLIVGADGVKSTVRTEILGSGVEPIPESIAYQFIVPSKAMEENPETASLMEDGRIHSWYGPGRQLICGSTGRKECYAVTLAVVPRKDDMPADLKDVVTARSGGSYTLGDIHAMRKTVDEFEPRVKTLVGLVRPEDCYLWKLSHLPKLDSWINSSNNAVLIGDAAHAMVPHLGMGAATAVEDGGVLAECLGCIRSLEDIPCALSAFQKIRKSRAEKIQEAALVAGAYKALPDGAQQRTRDQSLKARMDPSHPNYEAWMSGSTLDWLYGYDFLAAPMDEIRRTCSADTEKNIQSHL